MENIRNIQNRVNNSLVCSSADQPTLEQRRLKYQLYQQRYFDTYGNHYGCITYNQYWKGKYPNEELYGR